MRVQAARIELAAQQAKTAAGAAAVALPSPNKLPALEQDSSSPWGVKQRSIFRSDSAARMAARQGTLVALMQQYNIVTAHDQGVIMTANTRWNSRAGLRGLMAHVQLLTRACLADSLSWQGKHTSALRRTPVCAGHASYRTVSGPTNICRSCAHATTVNLQLDYRPPSPQGPA